MLLQCLGLNHRTAPLDLREQVAFTEKDIRAALAQLPSCPELSSSILEMVILSTCNRTEVYAVSNLPGRECLEQFLAESRGLSIQPLFRYFYFYQGLDVVRHLLEVAAGLDSQVLGESQILGQIVRALEISRDQKATRRILNHLFQAALHAGKRARSETAIARNPASVPSLAASLAERITHSLAEARVIILGAGEMAELTVEALRKRGVRQIRVINRTPERARVLAERWNASTSTLEDLPHALMEADILIASTSAPQALLSTAMVMQAMHLRPERPLTLIDIAVPRNIEPGCSSLPGVTLFDIDDLNEQLEQALAKRLAAVPHVRTILEEELASFNKYLHSLEVLPLIAGLHQQAEQIRQAELEKTISHLELSEKERARIEAMTRAMVKKILQEPIRRLREESNSQHLAEYTLAIRTLFGLDQVGKPLSNDQHFIKMGSTDPGTHPVNFPSQLAQETWGNRTE